MKFTKMQGAGNDFLIVDAWDEPLELSPSQIRYLCDRHYGIGADGLAILQKGRNGALARWIFFNCDGNEAEMCGNAARCAVRLLSDRYLSAGREISLETRSGVIRGTAEANWVDLTMFSVRGGLPDFQERVLKFGNENYRIYCIQTGVPHAVLEVEALRGFPIAEVGARIASSPIFRPEGTNVTFFQRVLGSRLLSSTYERGVDAETLACGTGVTASAIVFSQLYHGTFPVEVETPGGTLIVDRDAEGFVHLRGLAEYVMEIDLAVIPSDVQTRLPFGAQR